VHALRVVAAREGHHAAHAFVRRQLRESVVGAPKLEGAHALKILGLEQRPRTGPRVERAGRDDGRAMRDPAQPFRRCTHVVEGDLRRVRSDHFSGTRS